MPNNPKLAAWQDSPCPSWCVREHNDDDHPDDRYHDSAVTEFGATVASRLPEQGPGQWQLDDADISIVTSVHACGSTAITFIGRGDDVTQSLTLTPESAEQLARSLAEHLAMLEQD